MEIIKRALVGSVVGCALESVRERFRSIRAKPECWGDIAQEQIARTLITRLAERTFIDVGAHIGSVIAQVHRRTMARITAFEAIPEKAGRLVRKFPFATIHACALGETEGEVKFYIDQRSGYSSLADRTGRAEIIVPMRRLDDLVQDAEVIKLDVEGSELGVLRGARETVSVFRPVILFESVGNEGAALGYSNEALYDWFAQRDYDVVVPNRVAHDAPALRLEGFLEAQFYPWRTHNFFGIPREKREAVRDKARAILGIKR